ncbi:MAG: C40 family peptidase [Blastocatellia bacterium]
MTNLKKISYLSVIAFFVCILFGAPASAQDRERVVRTVSSQPINQPSAPQTDRSRSLTSSQPTGSPAIRPTLTNEIVIQKEAKPLVKKTGDSRPISAMMAAAGRRSMYGEPTTNAMLRGIQSRLGIPYLYGSTGPNRYDCSGFVWSVFNEAGVNFTRQSARSLWSMSVPVEGDERFKFGTLVFMNRLGHMGIVADENGFYHASSSKGITYSPFKGYWEKRIVGFRRLVTPLIDPKVSEKAK